MKTLKIFLVVLVAVVLTNAVTIMVLRPDSKSAETMEAAQEAPINVVVQELKATSVPDAVLLPASVEAYKSVTVPAEVAGVIETQIEEGVQVEEGQEIARIDRRTLEAELNQTRSLLELAKSNYDRNESLHAQKIVSDEQFDQVKSQYDAAKARFDVAQVAYDKAVIIAPADGILNRRYVERGEYVSAGDQVAEIVKVDKVKIAVDVPEKDIPYVGVGSVMGVRYDGAEMLVPGTVTYRSVVADPATRTYKAEITVDNPEARLLPGMIVRVVLLRRMIGDAIAVPLYSIVPRDGRAVAFVEQGGVAEERDVKLGVSDGDNVQITSGLAAGDRLIIEGQRQLENGQAVSVVSAVGAAK